VVIGFADTHGRPRTAEAAAGLETVPPRGGNGGGGDGDGADGGGADGGGADGAGGLGDGGGAGGAGGLGDGGGGRGEMDLDAVLARKPAVVLVDDFGRHIGAIASLRDAGIDVISTVDVCDLERAAADVQRITGRPPAAATVPDAALAEAGEIRFVDNSPEALRKRLGHGNIYPPGQANAALGGLFRTSSLAALREIGLRVVAETLTAPGAARPSEPLDVLVAVAVPAQADTLVQRGVRLARRSSGTCTVLALGPPAGAVSGDGTARVRSAAEAAGAAVIVREGRDTAAAIVQAARETRARHLVVAEPAAGLLERRRPSLAERLAAQLPDVSLHIIAAQARQGGASSQNGDSAAGAAGPARQQARGAIRVYLGCTNGVGITTAMLEEAGRRRSRGSDVVVAAVDGRGREGVSAALEGLELIGDGSTLDTEAVLARHPEVACIDDLSAVDASGESRFAAARRLADAGITIVATVHLASLRDSGPEPGDGPDVAAVLTLADEIEMVDVAPSILTDRVRRGEIVPEDQVEHALLTDYAPHALAALRERAFSVLVEHADRRRAGYRRRSSPAGSETQPVILGCAAPRAGMEPLIRRSAALAAQLAGDFLVAVVRPSQPPADLEQVLAGYTALTSQLGGRLAVLEGPPASALATFACQHHVTELVLARGTDGQAGRHPVLRDLVRGSADGEVHVLPAEVR
jgi:two-component system sensor histidine kinase KdpD